MSTDDFSEGHRDVWQTTDAVEPNGTATPGPDVVRVEPPRTGDADIDAVLQQVAQAQAGDLTGRISAAQEAQRVLQSRLSDLGGV